MNSILQYDHATLMWFQSNRLEFLDTFFYWITTTAKPISIVILIIIGLLYIKKSSVISKKTFFCLLSIFFTSVFITLILKYSVQRIRPFITHSNILQLTEPSRYSFPSGHTTIAFALAFGMLFLGFKKVVIIPIFFWAILVAFSRMILGAHYPTDILTAIIITFIISFCITIYLKEWKIKTT